MPVGSGPTNFHSDIYRQPRLRPQHVADMLEPGSQGTVEQMGVAPCRLNLRLAKKLSDQRQRHHGRTEQSRERVAKIVDTDAGQFRLGLDIFPKPLGLLKWLSASPGNTHLQTTGTSSRIACISAAAETLIGA